MMFTYRVIFFNLILFLLCASLQSQHCWKKFDPEHCSTFLITELGLSRLINQPTSFTAFQPSFQAELNIGYGTNLNSEFGIGLYGYGVASIGDGGAIEAGLRTRFSHYINGKYDLSITPGLIFHHSRARDVSLGYSVELAASLENKIGVFSRLDFLNLDSDPNNLRVNLGIRTGGARALFGAGSGFIIAGALIIATILAIS